MQFQPLPLVSLPNSATWDIFCDRFSVDFGGVAIIHQTKLAIVPPPPSTPKSVQFQPLPLVSPPNRAMCDRFRDMFSAVLKFACVPWTAHFKTAYPHKTYPGQRISKQRTPSKRTLDSAFQKSVPPKTVPRTAHFSVSENPTVPLDSVPPCPLNTWTVPHDSAFQLLEKPNRTPFCVPPGTKMGTVPPFFVPPYLHAGFEIYT